MKFDAIYARVSSEKQDLRSQLPDLEKWKETTDQKWRMFTDKFTGKTMDRPGWKELEMYIDCGKVNRLIVWRLDRLGRTASGLINLFEKLNKMDVGLVSIKDGIDLSTPAGRLIAHVLASVAAYENEVRSERVMAGIQHAKAQGKKWGGSQKGRLWRRTPEKIDIIFKMHDEGQTIATIARTVELSRHTVTKTLKGE